MSAPNAYTPAVPIAPFYQFTDFTPAVPDLYWNVYSAEERMKKLCMEMHKMVEYANALGIAINVDHDIINELEVSWTKLLGDGYVPQFADPLEWDDSTDYAALTIVTFHGNSYTSRQYVPAGTSLDDSDYWVETGNYNAQIEDYRQRVIGVESEVNNINTILPSEMFDDVNTVYNILSTISSSLTQLSNKIPATDFTAESTVKAYIDENVNTINELITNFQSIIPASEFNATHTVLDYINGTSVPYPTGSHSKYGTSSQVLGTLGNGQTVWQDPVTPSDAQAETYITAWLNDHPEATTTVEDGAISTAKLANGAVTDQKLAQSGGILDAMAQIEKNISEHIYYRFLFNSDDGWENKTYTADPNAPHGYTITDSSSYSLSPEVEFSKDDSGIYIAKMLTEENPYIAMLTLDANGDFVGSTGQYADSANFTLNGPGKFRIRLSTGDTTYVERNNIAIKKNDENSEMSSWGEEEARYNLNIIMQSLVNKYPLELPIWQHGSLSNDGTYAVSANVLTTRVIPFRYSKFDLVADGVQAGVTLLDKDLNYVYLATANNTTIHCDVSNLAYYQPVEYAVFRFVKTNVTFDDVHNANVYLYPRVDAKRTKLRVMSYNAGWYRFGETASSSNGWTNETGPDNLANLKQLFADTLCDIVGLQEDATYAGPNDTWNLYNLLYSIAYKNKINTATELRIASNLNLRNFYTVNYTGGGGSFRCEVMEVDDKSLLVIDAHLPTSDSTTRANIIDQIIDEMDKFHYAVLLMDSNIESTTELQPFTTAGYKLGNGDYFGTKNTTASNHPFDNIVVSPTIMLESFEVLSDYASTLTSDHYPVVSDIILL